MGEIERLYTKERFEEIRGKFISIDDGAEAIISGADDKDIISFKISIDSPKKVISAELTTPKEYLKSCVM